MEGTLHPGIYLDFLRVLLTGIPRNNRYSIACHRLPLLIDTSFGISIGYWHHLPDRYNLTDLKRVGLRDNQ